MSLGETVRDPTWLMYTANTPLLFTPTLGNGDLPFTGQGEVWHSLFCPLSERES